MTDEMELSEREIEIIRLVATGASNKEIANKLVISPNTVKVHLRNIFGKLGVLSRTEATMKAIKMGLVESPGTNLQSKQEGALLSDLDTQSMGQQEVQRKATRKRKTFILVGIGVIVLLIAILLWPRVLRSIFVPDATLSVDNLEELNSNRWSSYSKMPFGLSQMGFVRYENQFYLFGGKTDLGLSDQLLIFDIYANSWSEGLNLPTKLTDIQAVILGEKIYVAGGMDENGEVKSNMLIYDPRENTWENAKELPVSVSGYAIAPYEGKIYLFGGFDGENYLNSIYEYDPALEEWVLFGNMEEEVAFQSAVVLGGKIHLLGGITENGILKEHKVYYPQREIVGENPWETAADLPEERYRMNSIVLADMIFAAGGINSQDEFLPVIQYFPQQDSWVEVSTSTYEIGSSPAVLPYETHLYIFGGTNASGYSDQSLAYQAFYTVLVPVIQKD